MTRMARRTRGRHRQEAPQRSSPLTGTGTLLKASLRYDAHTIAPWILIATVLSFLLTRRRTASLGNLSLEMEDKQSPPI